MPETTPLHAETEAQIAALSLRPERPVVICDADEVLFQFLIALEEHLKRTGWRLDLRKPPSLYGNIFPAGGGAAMEDEAVVDMLEAFYASHVEALQPIPGAAQALAALSRRAQVLIVTNLPFAYRDGRRRALLAHGMDYPVIANSGRKGAAVKKLLQGHNAPAFFVEDMRIHLDSAKDIDGLCCIQLITHRRLAEVMERASHAWQARNWSETLRHIEARLEDG